VVLVVAGRERSGLASPTTDPPPTELALWTAPEANGQESIDVQTRACLPRSFWHCRTARWPSVPRAPARATGSRPSSLPAIVWFGWEAGISLPRSRARGTICYSALASIATTLRMPSNLWRRPVRPGPAPLAGPTCRISNSRFLPHHERTLVRFVNQCGHSIFFLSSRSWLMITGLLPIGLTPQAPMGSVGGGAAGFSSDAA
jgi:hypothetical protein